VIGADSLHKSPRTVVIHRGNIRMATFVVISSMDGSWRVYTCISEKKREKYVHATKT
jgi:hypothetical protein